MRQTGNYYYGARYYNPKWSTWLSVDPLASKYPNLSPYNYTLNNPIKYIDPNGEEVDVSALVKMNWKSKSEIKRDKWLLKKLTNSLSQLSGETISVHTDENGRSIIYGSGSVCDSDQNNTKVAKYIRHLLAPDDEGTNTISLKGGDDVSAGWAYNSIVLGASQVNGMQEALEKNGLSKDIMSMGLVFLHETLHTGFGASFYNSDADNKEKTDFFGISYFDDLRGDYPGGPTQKRINDFRVQLGLPIRINRALKIKDGNKEYDVKYTPTSPRDGSRTD